MATHARTSLFVFIGIVIAWFSCIIILDFYRTGPQVHTSRPRGYIGVVIDPQHDGLQYAQRWVNEQLNAIITEEIQQALPAYTDDLPTFHRSRNRCHTTLAYLKSNTPRQLTAITTMLHEMLRNKPFLQTPFYLSSQLKLFGLEADTIVMMLHDPNQILHMLHPYIEHTLAHVSNQLHEVIYTPWETIGEFIPHITVSKIDFEPLKEFVGKHNGNGDAVEYRIRQRVEAEVLPHFVIPDSLREVAGTSFTLFDSQRKEYETFILKERQ